MNIQVLGTGCPTCDKVFKTVQEAVKDSGRDISVEKVTDLQTMASMGVLTPPAVAVDGRVRLAGKVPSREEILELIQKS